MFFFGISHPTKKIPIQGIKIPKLRKIPIPGIKIPRPKKSRISGISENPDGQKAVKTQNFYFEIFKGSREIFKSRSRSPGFRDFSLGIFFEIFKFRSRSPEFSGFLDLAQNKKTRGFGIGIRDPEKMPFRSQLWLLSC